jgi:hypothetical protein
MAYELSFRPSEGSYRFGDSGSEEVSAAETGRVPYAQSMVDAVETINIAWGPAIYTTGVLESLSGLQHSSLMQPTAASDSEAQLKAAYWLHAAARSFDRGSDARERLEKKADGLAEQGESGVFDEGSSSQVGKITGIYADAARALKTEAGESPNAVQRTVISILEAGTQAANVQDAVRKAEKQAERAGADAAGREESATPCEESWKRFLPLYCARERAASARGLVVPVAVGLALLGGAVFAYQKWGKS